MSGTPTWIVGSGGLLGRRLAAALDGSCRLWRSPETIAWASPLQARAQLERAMIAFADEVARRGRGWRILWTAGVAWIGAPPALYAAETEIFAALLELAARWLPGTAGMLFLASSAGGLYSGDVSQPFDERSPPSPIGAYGRNKEAQERLSAAWHAATGASLVVGRIATLYGARASAQPQGFIARVSRCLLQHEPIHVFVPLDTIRDFLYVDDCAAQIAATLALAGAQPAPVAWTKIFADERAVSLRQVLGVFARITRRMPRIITPPLPVAAEHPLRLCYRSTVPPFVAPRTTLERGIEELHRHDRALFAAGRLRAAG